MVDITITLTMDEAKYIAQAIDTHIKTHGLGVATAGVMIVSKLQTASNGIAEPRAVKHVPPGKPEKTVS